MTTWSVVDVNLGTSYQAFNINVEKSLRGFNNATFDSTDTIQLDTLVDIKYGTSIILRGYIKNIRENEDGTKTYTVVERAIELKDTILTDANGNYKFFKQDTVDNLVDWILTNIGWTRATTSSDTTSLFLSFSFTSVYNALMKILHELRGHNVWFDNINKVVYFDSQRDNEGTIIPLKKETENDTHKYNIGKVIVIGKYEDVWAEFGTGTRTVVYKYTDAKTQQECQSMAERLYNELNQTYNRITVTLTVHPAIDEGDLVTVDGTDYIVQEVTVTEYDMRITLNQAKQTLLDVLSDKLTEVSGTVGVATAFDDIVTIASGSATTTTPFQTSWLIDGNTSYSYYKLRIVLDTYGGGGSSTSVAPLSNELYVLEWDDNKAENIFGYNLEMAAYSPISVPSDKDYQGVFAFLIGGVNTDTDFNYLVLSDGIIYDASDSFRIYYDGTRYIFPLGVIDGFYNTYSGIISYDSTNGFQYTIKYDNFGHYYKNNTDGGYVDGISPLSDGYLVLASDNILKFNTNTNSYSSIGTFTGVFNKYTNIVKTRSDGCAFVIRGTTSPYKIIYKDYDNSTSTLSTRSLVTSNTISFQCAYACQDSNGVVYLLFTDSNGNLYCLKSSDHFATWSEINGSTTYDSSLGAVDVSNLTPLTLPTVNNSTTIHNSIISPPTMINGNIYFVYHSYDSTAQTISLVLSKIDLTTNTVSTVYEFTNVPSITYVPSVYYTTNGYYYVTNVENDVLTVRYSNDLINWTTVQPPSIYEEYHYPLVYYSELYNTRSPDFVINILKNEILINNDKHIHNRELLKVDTATSSFVSLGDVLSSLITNYRVPSICYSVAEKDESVNTGYVYSYGNVRGKQLYIYLIEAPYYASIVSANYGVYCMYKASFVNVFLIPKLIDTIPVASSSDQSAVTITVDFNGNALGSYTGASEYEIDVTNYINVGGNNTLTISTDTDVDVTIYALMGGVRYA